MTMLPQGRDSKARRGRRPLTHVARNVVTLACAHNQKIPNLIKGEISQLERGMHI